MRYESRKSSMQVTKVPPRAPRVTRTRLKRVPVKNGLSTLKRSLQRRVVVSMEKSKRVKGEKSLSKLKKELDRIFSIYIRTKYSKQCFTCGRSGMLQNGHFIVRKYLATRWEEDNCRPQCVGCNIYGKGMSVDFEERLIKELGPDRVSQMKESRKELWKLDRAWYELKITKYKSLVDKLSD